MELDQIQMLLVSAIGLLMVLVVFFLVRHLITYQKKKEEREKRETTQVSFVVDTFHELVSKLKEKERELEALRSRAEERASSSELYSQNIIQSVPSGVVSFDQELRVTSMNVAALSMLDLRQEDVIGRGCADIFQSPVREMLSERRVVERAETAYIAGSGKRLWIGLTISPLKDSLNAVIGQLLVFTDLTELKAFQSQKELRDRLSTLGEMSAGIAHELRNPLAVISGYTKILSKKTDDTLKPAVYAIGKEVEVMDRIITDFLSFARPAEPSPGSVDLGELIRSCIAMIGDAAQRVTFLPEASYMPAIRADEVLLRQAIYNLLRNAAEATSENGVIIISCERDGRNLRVTITDTGHGIPDNIRDKIFLPFYTTKERGTGLGLAIVHKIIVSHGGSVGVESADGRTIFSVTLPLDATAGDLRSGADVQGTSDE